MLCRDTQVCVHPRTPGSCISHLAPFQLSDREGALMDSREMTRWETLEKMKKDLTAGRGMEKVD